MAFSPTARVLFINSPNANLYGHAGQATCGSETFEQLGERSRRAAEGNAIALDFRQSNSEGDVATGIVAGLGADGCEMAVLAMCRLLDRPKA